VKDHKLKALTGDKFGEGVVDLFSHMVLGPAQFVDTAREAIQLTKRPGAVKCLVIPKPKAKT